MKVTKELSRIVLGEIVIRELMTDCDIHGQTKHRDINGNIDCCQCSDDKLHLASAERRKIEKRSMRELLTSKMKSRKNSYASKLKKPVTMRLGEDVINYL